MISNFGNQPIRSVEIINLNGNIVKLDEYAKGTGDISAEGIKVSSLPSGAYTVRIILADGSKSVKKVIISH